MNKIKALALVLLATASVGAFAQKPSTAKVHPTAISAPYTQPSVYNSGGNAIVSNPNDFAVVVDYLITVMFSDGSTRIYSRRALVGAYSSFTDYASGFYVSDADLVSWRLV